MKITFDKKVEVTLEFDVEKVAEHIVKSYREEYSSEDPDFEYIYDDVCNNMITYLEEFGLSKEDEDAIIDLDIDGYDVLSDLVRAVQDYIEIKYKF